MSRDTGETILEYIVYLPALRHRIILILFSCSIATLHATKKWLFISDVETRLNVTKLLDNLASYDHEQVALSLVCVRIVSGFGREPDQSTCVTNTSTGIKVQTDPKGS